MRLRSQFVALAAALLLSDCGSSSPSAPAPAPPVPTPAANADFTVMNDPSPVIASAAPANAADFPWQIQWNFRIQETNGLGGNIDFLNVGFRNSFGFETPNVLNFGADRIITLAGTNHIVARGSLSIPLRVFYRADGFGGRSALFTVAAQFHDDAGHLIVKAAMVQALFVGETRGLD